MKSMIKAKSDASCKKYGDKSCVGIGLAIHQHNGINFTHYEKYVMDNRLDSYYAELIGIITLLKKMQKLKGENIVVIGDNAGLIGNINNNKVLIEYQLEWDFLLFLINNIKSKNNIKFKWQVRSKNQECDELSKKIEKHEFEYQWNGENKIFRCEAQNKIEAKQKFEKHMKILKGERVLNNEQTKKDLNKMLKNFKKSGIAYA